MSTTDITRAWKDCAFRDSLTDEQRALVPAHPAGASAAHTLGTGAHAMFAAPTHPILTMACCDGLTQSPGYCSWFCGIGNLFMYGDTAYGCCTPGRTL